jgi:hypothetical protein
VEDGFEEAAASGLGGSELRFKPVAKRHQLFDFGDDAVLFGKGGEGKNKLVAWANYQIMRPGKG